MGSFCFQFDYDVIMIMTSICDAVIEDMVLFDVLIG